MKIRNKVIFIARLFLPHWGGVEKHLYNLSKNLIERGYKVTVLTEKYASNLKDEEIIDRIRVVRFSYPKIKFLGLFYIWLWLFKNFNLIKKSDLVHIHDVFIWYLPLRFILPKKKVYTTFHGWEGKYPIPLKNRLYKKIACLLSDSVISVGKYIEKYYGIKSDYITFGAVDIPKPLKFRKRKKMVYVGRLSQDKDIKKFLSFLRLIKGYEIEFCGDGEFRNDCQRLGRVLGYVDPSIYLSQAKYVLTSGYMSILEALSRRCIVICTYSNSFMEDILRLTPFKDFIICDGDNRKLYKKFVYYESHPEKAKDLVDKGYNWVRGQSWRNLTEVYLKLWRKE